MSTDKHHRLARNRVAILGALNTAAQDPRRILDLVVQSHDKDQAIGILMATYGWSSTQAHAVLNLQVGQWSEMGRQSIAADLSTATNLIDRDGDEG